jgi:hypothetical protein
MARDIAGADKNQFLAQHAGSPLADPDPRAFPSGMEHKGRR